MESSTYRKINVFVLYVVAVVATMAMGLVSRAMHEGVSLSIVVGDVMWVNLFGFASVFQSLLFIYGILYYLKARKYRTDNGWSAVEHSKRFARFYTTCVVIAFVGMTTFGIAVRVL